MINSVFRRLIKFSGSFALSFPEFLPFLHYLVAKLHLNHCKDSPCVFQLLFPFVWPFFYYRSSSWRFYMMVHKGCNSFSKCSSRFFSEELKHSSSCNTEFYSFNRIIGDGIMSFLIIWIHVSWFTCCHEWDISNPSISSLELSWVIFHLKPSLRIVAIYGAYKWPKFFFYPPGDIAFLSPCSYQSNSSSREWQVVTS